MRTMALLPAARSVSRQLHLHRRRFLSSSAGPSRLLGHFHHPVSKNLRHKDTPPSDSASTPAPAIHFQPLTATSPRLSLDSVPDPGFSLCDSYAGLLLLLRQAPEGPGDARCRLRPLVVFDPVSRRDAQFYLPPKDLLHPDNFIGCAILSRGSAMDDLVGGLRFEAVFVGFEAEHRRRLHACVASFRDGACHWCALSPSRELTVVGFKPACFDPICVHAAGSLYWHICDSDSALALDPATMEFSFLRAPELMWDTPRNEHVYRIGEMPGDGQLCVASLNNDVLQLCVRSNGEDSDNGWELERRVDMRGVLDQVPGLPKNPMARKLELNISQIDAGRTGKVFITTAGHGRFSYHMDTGKLERLETEDGLEYGHPILAYFSAPDGCSD